MAVDCQWIEKNLEALQCDRLSQEEGRLAKAHIENCVSCKKEMQALNAVDPVIQNYFRRELEVAQRPRAVHRARVFGFGGAAAAVAVLVLLVVLQTVPTPVVTRTLETPQAVKEIASSAPESPKPEKIEEAAQDGRSKPVAEPSPAPDRRPPAAVANNAPDFLVSDPAGYSHSLDEYRGHVALIAVWAREQADIIANIERLYKAYGANPKIRFLGVTNEHRAKAANTTFPVLYNEGSKLLDTQPGEFVLLNENGSVELRGSLVKDFDVLSRTIRSK